MDANECKTKKNIHNNKRKQKITREKKLPTTLIHHVFNLHMCKMTQEIMHSKNMQWFIESPWWGW